MINIKSGFPFSRGLMKVFHRHINTEKKLFSEIFIIFITISLISILLLGAFFYFYTTRSMVSNFKIKTEKTAKEISEILSVSLYNVDNDGVIKNARVYLLSGSLSGIEINSAADGLLIKDVTDTDSMIEPITVELSLHNIHLGSATFRFNDSEIKNTQHTMILFIILSVIISIIVSGSLIYLIIYRLFKPTLENIQKKIEEVADGTTHTLLADSKYIEFNQIIRSVNNMSSEISSKTFKLIQSEKKYSEIFNNIYVAVIIHDHLDNIIDVNETMMRMFGLSSKEEAFRYSLKNDYSDSANPIDKMDDAWKKVMDGDERHFEWIARKPLTGEVFCVYISLKKFVLNDTPYLLTNIIDITERKIAEEKLIHAQKMEALGTLSGGLAHDFNNTLMGITAPISMIEQHYKDIELPDKDLFNEYTGIIKKSADRATGIISRLLSIARKQNFKFELFNLNQTLMELIRFSESTIDKSIEIRFNHPDKDAFIIGDINQIEQVFLNLIVNASHSMTFMRNEDEKWGGKLDITISSFYPDAMFLAANINMKEIDYWKVEIKDTGVGISKENLLKIFNPFFTTKENGKGTGLGLSMVYNIIKQHEGHISVYSEPGIGTVFNVFLPVPEEEVCGKTESPDKINRLKNRREGVILIIDDDESVSKTVKTMLEKSGYDTYTTDDCLYGIDYFKNNFMKVNAVILDYSMPRFTGKDVFLELVKINPEVKVLLTSGFGLDDRTIPLLEMGVKGFLKKPFTLDQLLEAIDSIIN